jgi:hypothetical protein
MPDDPKVHASSLTSAGFRALFRAPFIWLLAIGILGIFATSSIGGPPEDELALVGVVVVALISVYTSIALTLAAAEDEPDGSPERWVRAALVRRCWIRTFLSGIFAFLLVFAGLVALVVPGFIIGAAVALSDIGAVLENHRPGDAIRRSIELSKPARKPIGIVFGLLVTVPSMSLQLTTYFVDVEPEWIVTAAQCLNYILASAAHIALTKAFLQLGGKNLARSEPGPIPERL